MIMKIRLLISGGQVAGYEEAIIESDISDKELAELLSVIEIKGKSKGADRINYFLEVKGKEVRINPDLIPEKFTALWNELEKNKKRKV